MDIEIPLRQTPGPEARVAVQQESPDGASLKMGNGAKLSNDNCDTHITTARQQRGRYSGPLAVVALRTLIYPYRQNIFPSPPKMGGRGLSTGESAHQRNY